MSVAGRAVAIAPTRIRRATAALLASELRGRQDGRRGRAPTISAARVALPVWAILVRHGRRLQAPRTQLAQSCMHPDYPPCGGTAIVLGGNPAADPLLLLLLASCTTAGDAASKGPQDRKHDNADDHSDWNRDLEVGGVPCLGGIEGRARLAVSVAAGPAIAARRAVYEVGLEQDALVRRAGVLTRYLAAPVVPGRTGLGEIEREADRLALHWGA